MTRRERRRERASPARRARAPRSSRPPRRRDRPAVLVSARRRRCAERVRGQSRRASATRSRPCAPIGARQRRPLQQQIDRRNQSTHAHARLRGRERRGYHHERDRWPARNLRSACCRISRCIGRSSASGRTRSLPSSPPTRSWRRCIPSCAQALFGAPRAAVFDLGRVSAVRRRATTRARVELARASDEYVEMTVGRHAAPSRAVLSGRPAAPAARSVRARLRRAGVRSAHRRSARAVRARAVAAAGLVSDSVTGGGGERMGRWRRGEGEGPERRCSGPPRWSSWAS